MVRLEGWMRCLLLLMMFSAGIFHQPPNEVKTQIPDFKNKSSPLSQKQIVCENILTLQHADPNNKTIGKVPFCTENVTSPSAQNSTNCTDNPLIKPPDVFPKEGANETEKFKCINTLQGVLQSNSSTNNSDSSISKAESTITNANIPGSTNNSNVANDKAEAIITNAIKNSSKSDLQDGNVGRDVSKGTNVRNLNATHQIDTNSSKTDTEVSDLNSRVNSLTPSQIPDTAPNVKFNETQKVDKETESVEDGKNTEDMLRNSTSKEKLANPGVPLVQGQLAAILAGVFVVISVTAYVGLLSWRRYLENRYGNREMLVNEEEFNDDLRHFSI